MTKSTAKQEAKKNSPGATTLGKKGHQKKEKHLDDDTRNTGFRSSRVRDAESRTTKTGDPSVS
jgi:hypothetical protein